MSKMRTFTLIAVCVILSLSGGSLSPVLGQTDVTPEQIPIFIYAFAGNRDFVNARDHGVLIDWLDERSNRVNEPDRTALYEVLADLPRQERFEKAFGCVFTTSSDSCQPIVFLDEEPSAESGGTDALEQVFAEYGASRAWVLHVHEEALKMGYKFNVLAVDLEVSPGRNLRHKDVLVEYQDLFSSGSDADSRGLGRGVSSADPEIGSHDARAEYWAVGSPPRIESLALEAPEAAADMLRYLVSYTQDMTTKEYKKNIKSLDRLRDVDLYSGARCRAHSRTCKARVVDQTEDRVRVFLFAGRPIMSSLNIPGLY